MKRFFTLLILALGFSAAATAQNSITLRFTGENADNAYVRLDSVTVENLTRNWTETICYPDTIMHLSSDTDGTGIDDVPPATVIFGVTNVRPNPFDGTTRFDLVMPEAGKVHLRITDVNGKLVTALDENLPGGIHTYEVILRLPATYVLHASGRLGTSTAKLVNTGGGSHDGILRAGFAGGVEIRLPVKNIAIHPFQLGDVMRYTGFASYNGTVYTSTPIEQTQSESEDFVLQFDIALSSSDNLTFTVDNVTFTMIPVPGGTFWMGAQTHNSVGQNYDADAEYDEIPVHQVTLSDYYMGETEVTQALWQTIMGNNGGAGRENYPKDYVSWNDICDTGGFLEKLNAALSSELGGKHFALPTEAQWEFAARGGNQSHGYKYAGSDSIGDVAWYYDNWTSGNSGNTTHPVKGKLPNELGLYDMSGNVWEWCADWYGSSYYSSSPSSNPTGPESGDSRVERGGSGCYGARCCRVSDRSSLGPSLRYNNGHGFRLALSDGSDIPPDTVSVTGISLDKTVLTLQEGESDILTATVTPENATNQNVTWTSDNTAVATVVNGGRVTAVSAGSATITVTTEDGGKTATCAVTVTPSSGGGVEGTLTFTANGVTFNMIPVPGGTFWMGAQRTDPDGQNYDWSADDNESPVHQVTLSSYYMGETEVTQALWYAVMGQRPTCDYFFKWNSEEGLGDDYPAYIISWYDAQSFVTALNAATASQRGDKTFAMPTEAQWEFAARGGNSSHGYWYAGSDNIHDVAWFLYNIPPRGTEGYGTQPVRTKSPNELGLYDMSGNVEEWCSDWYGDYSSGSQTNPTGPESGSDPVLRSGILNYADRYSRVSRRGNSIPGSGLNGYKGFRLALSDGSDTPPDTVSVTGVSLKKSTLTLIEGAFETLVATVTPENATNQNVTWTSDNTAVATVDNAGRVTAVSAGSATITVTTEDGGKTATCTVTVTSGGGGGVEGALTFTANGVTFNMIPVPGGTFWMGAQRDPDGHNLDWDADDDERPVHQVTLSDYYMGETEVTQALWQAVTGQTPTSDGSQWSSSYGIGDNYPAYYISWEDIQGFLTALNAATASQRGNKTFTMPTEAQWEFAARGGNLSHGYKYAGSNNIGNVAWYDDSAYNVGISHPDYGPHVVKTRSPNELGLYDMSGNVCEWCKDFYNSSYYSSSPSSNPTGPSSGSYRVLRGGSWSFGAKHCRVSYRHYGYYPDFRYYFNGFRLALSDDSDTPPGTVSVTGVSLDKTVLTLQEGESDTLTATVMPGNATNQNVTWTSDNTAVATVDNAGKVTAVSAGSATITVTTEDGGKTATCTVTVTTSGGGVEGALTFTVGTGADSVTFNMIPVPGGTFRMGAQKSDPEEQNYDTEADDDERPVHQVTLSSYHMGETEVTQALWQAVTGQSPTSDGAQWNQWNSTYGYGNNYPAYSITWDDIQGFLTALNAATASQRGNKTFALPTEAQWEFAARGGNQSHGYRYAGNNSIENVAWYYDNACAIGSSHPDYGTHVVKTKLPNELGLYDMSGNVWEWCKDWKGDYGSDSQTDPQYSTYANCRVLRGGSWGNYARDCRVSDRSCAYPDYRNYRNGFRLALSDGSDTTPDTVSVTGVSLNKTVLILQEGESETLVATITPENATNQNVSWTSGNTAVATVDNAGKVTAVSAGSATITVTTEDGGKTATCTVRVTSSGGVEGALTFTANGVTFNMIPVPGGTFWMGAQKTDRHGQNYDADADSSESPVHQVTLSSYYMGETEVTQALWLAVMSSWPGPAPSSTYGVGNNYPAYNISWDDIQSFLTALNAATASQRGDKTFAMPTEAQWEFAARGGNSGHGYKYAGSNSVEDVAWHYWNAYYVGSSHPDYGTHVVKTKSPNELGLYDMSGNVWEWCRDWYGDYGSGSQSNPTGPESGTDRMLRGGSLSSDARYCRVSYRIGINPGSRYGGYGFRLVLLP